MQFFYWFVIVVCGGILSAYTSKYQEVTLWAGKMVSPPGSDHLNPTGSQDAITPKAQGRRNVLNIGFYIVTLVLGTYLNWWQGVLGVIVFVVVHSIFKYFMPNTIEYYLRPIIHSIANREADFLKRGDHMRAEAARAFFIRLTELLERVSNNNLKLPEYSEIRRMKNGGLFS